MSGPAARRWLSLSARSCCAVRLTSEMLALVLALVAAADAPVPLPLIRADGAFDSDEGLLSFLGSLFSVTASVHATQPSKSSWEIKLTNGRKFMSTSTIMPNNVK